jgi:hypothetical protein
MKKYFIMMVAGVLMSLSAYAREDAQKIGACPSDEAVIEAIAKFNRGITYDDALEINDKKWGSNGITQASPDQREIQFAHPTLSANKFFCEYSVVTAVCEGQNKAQLKKSTFKIGRPWEKGENPHDFLK